MSILDTLIDERPFGQTSQISIQDERVVCLGLDNGNDAAKLTLLNSTGTLVSLRIPTAYQPARTFQGGSGEVTYHLDGLADFWIGEAAIRNDGRRCRSARLRSVCPTHANIASSVPAWSRRCSPPAIRRCLSARGRVCHSE